MIYWYPNDPESFLENPSETSAHLLLYTTPLTPLWHHSNKET
jgi:hypothetical protein